MDLHYTCGHCTPVARNSLHLTAEGKGEKEENFYPKITGAKSRPNRPFPSSPRPPFQSEAKFILKLELITITKISHLASL